MARPRTRPHPLDPGILDRMVERVVAGEAVVAICQDKDMPHAQQVYNVMANDEGFRTAIARAREVAQDAIVDQIQHMADEATVENWQVVQLRIRTRQWAAAKLRPSKYGDHVQHDVTRDSPVAALLASIGNSTLPIASAGPDHKARAKAAEVIESDVAPKPRDCLCFKE